MSGETVGTGTNLVLVGFKASGKSTTGRALAALTGMTFVDTDRLLESVFAESGEAPLSCREIYARRGPDFLRELESEVLRRAAALQRSVVATGGGIVLCPENRPLLRRAGVCIFLDVSLPVLEERLKNVKSPLFAEKSVAEVHKERLPLYMETAHIRLTPAPGDTPEGVAVLVRQAAFMVAMQGGVHGQ